MARENERVLMFSPSFTLFVSDLYSTMTRIFSLLFRMGKLPRPPRAVLRVGRDGSVAVGEPRAVYQSHIALVLRRLQSEGMDRSLQRLNMMMQAAPDLAAAEAAVAADTPQPQVALSLPVNSLM